MFNQSLLFFDTKKIYLSYLNLPCKLIYIFEINNKNLIFLNKLVSSIFKNDLDGLILFIDKNSLEVNNLFFLKKLILHFHLNKKKIGVWGLPCCIEKYLYSGFDYLRFSNFLIKPNILFLIFNNFYFFSSQLINCKFCVKYNNCIGLGINKKNFNLWNFPLRNIYRTSLSNKYTFKNNFLNNSHKLFIDHISNSNLEFADKSIHYCFTNNKKSSHIFSERFIYYSHYLQKEDIKFEFDFLNNISKNSYVQTIQSLYEKLFLKGYAYSLAYNDKESKSRETFYLFFSNDKYILSYLNSFSFDYKIEFFENYYFLGLDYSNSLFSGLKLYTKINNFSEFINYLNKKFNFEMDFFKNYSSSYDFLYVRRYNNIFNLEGFKIEFKIKKLSELITFCKNNNLEIAINSDNIFIERLALDFDLNGKLNKLVIYYKPILKL